MVVIFDRTLKSLKQLLLLTKRESYIVLSANLMKISCCVRKDTLWVSELLLGHLI